VNAPQARTVALTQVKAVDDLYPRLVGDMVLEPAMAAGNRRLAIENEACRGAVWSAPCLDRPWAYPPRYLQAWRQGVPPVRLIAREPDKQPPAGFALAPVTLLRTDAWRAPACGRKGRCQL